VRREHREIVERDLGRRIENVKPPKDLETGCFVSTCGIDPREHPVCRTRRFSPVH
jgi:hypothetical protein